MCRVSFNVDYNVDSNLQVLEAKGRYRPVGSSNTWTEFNIEDLSNALTPDISQRGQYELEIRIKDSDNLISDWGGNTTFEIDCDYVPEPPFATSITYPNNKNCCDTQI